MVQLSTQLGGWWQSRGGQCMELLNTRSHTDLHSITVPIHSMCSILKRSPHGGDDAAWMRMIDMAGMARRRPQHRRAEQMLFLSTLRDYASIWMIYGE